MIDHEHRVAIIGGGLAGLACAHALREAGIEPTVFDRGRFPGGRLSSRSVPAEQKAITMYDYGAPMIHVDEATFMKQCTDWIEEGAAAWWTPIHEHPDRTVTREHRVLAGVPGMNSIIDLYSKQAVLKRSINVSALKYADGFWTLVTESYQSSQNTIEQFDHVVLAMPAAQARRLIDTAKIGCFQPLNALSSITTWVCMMKLDLGFQTESIPDIIDTDEGDRIVFSHRRPGRTINSGWTTMVYYANHVWSEEHRDLHKDDLTPLIRMRALRAIGLRLNSDVRPEHVLDLRVHRWGLARSEVRLEDLYLYNRAMRVGCCGDWVARGDAQAAYLSGRSLADAMLRD